MITHLKPIVDGHVHPQAHADQGPAIEKCLTGFFDVDPGGAAHLRIEYRCGPVPR